MLDYDEKIAKQLLLYCGKLSHKPGLTAVACYAEVSVLNKRVYTATDNSVITEHICIFDLNSCVCRLTGSAAS